jgi:hypothetical protein
MSGILLNVARGLGEGIVTGLIRRFRCAHPEALTASGRWGLNTLTYWQTIAFPNVDPNKVAAIYAQACTQWSDVCALGFAPATSQAVAHVQAVSGPIDGQWNVLALSELPPTNNFGGILHQTFDQAEFLSDGEILACMCHEMGHVLGLGHSGTGNLMAPVLDPGITAPQPQDIAAIQALYGPPQAVPAPPPLPPPGPVPMPPGPAGGPSTPQIDVQIAGVGTLSLIVQIVGFKPV